jgi:hypothetical protein
MEALNKTSGTSAVMIFTGDSKTNAEVRRELEIFPWIGITVIWIAFVFFLYLIWVKSNTGV